MLQRAALRWCSLIIKSPKIQEFHNQFSDELAKIISVELNKSSKAFNHYIRQPPQPVQPRTNEYTSRLSKSLQKHKYSNPDSLAPWKLLSTAPMQKLD